MFAHQPSRRIWGRSLARTCAATALALTCGFASAEDAYPQRPITMVVGFAAGGGVDAAARLLSTQLSTRLGHQVIVDNRPGAAGMIAGDRVAKAPADGYTVLMADYSSLTIAIKASPKPLFDVLSDFKPIAMVATMPLVVAVSPTLPANNLQELVAIAKREPDKLSYASPGIASAHQLAMEWIKQSLGIQLQHVPYKGAAAMMPDVMSGVVPVGVMSAAAAIGPYKAGKIKVLGVTGKLVVADAPEWKPISEVVPGFDASPRLFLLAPPATPPQIVAKLAAAVKESLASPEFGAGLAKLGGVVTYAEGEAAAKEMQRETQQWAEVVRKAGVTLE